MDYANPIEVSYGWPDHDEDEDWDGRMNIESARVSTTLQAAEMIHRLDPPWFRAEVDTPEGGTKDITDKVHHAMLVYVRPHYRDQRGLSSDSFKEGKAKIEELRRKIAS